MKECYTLLVENDGDDETINTEHTRHDDGNNVTHDKLRIHHTHGGNTNAGLSSSVGSAQV